MPRSHRRRIDLGGWTVAFDVRTASLACRHRPTGASLRGLLSCYAADGSTLTVTETPGAAPERLMLRDARGDGQLYLQLGASGHDLLLTLVPRGRTRSQGRLTFTGAAAVGRDTFACRTFPPADVTVVQMASGPADGALNDSLFDVTKDVALRFRAEQVTITGGESAPGGRPRFAVQLEARVDRPAGSRITISAEPRFYRDTYVPWYRPLDRTRLPSAPTGWMSWNTYFDQAGEAENLAEARLGAKHLKPYGLQIWSVESWQDNSPSLPVSQFHHLTLRPYAAQFPHGMKWLAAQIRRLGFVPGLWTVPFGTGDEEFYQQHKRWFLHHPDGRPMSNWCGRYVLDPSQPAVLRHMTESHRAMAAWGYEFLKIDGIFGGSRHYSAHFYELPEVRAAFQRPVEDPLAFTVRALRRGLGPDRVLLACAGHYTGPEVAVSDAARIGGDVVSPNQPPNWHSYVEQANMILSCLFVHGIVWYCDPDTLLVGTYSPLAQVRAAASAIALAGQVTFAGDKLGELPEGRLWLLQRCLPVCPVRPLDLYPINHLVPVWDLKVCRPFAHWDVVSVFNFGEERGTITAELADLGLSPERPYLVYDFWQERLLGRFTGRVSLEVAPRSNRLLAIHEDLGRPQFLSTDRHLTQGATSLRALDWGERSRTLSGEIELVAGQSTSLTFFVPEGYHLEGATAKGAQVVAAEGQEGNTLRLVLRSPRAGAARWQVRFALPGGEADAGAKRAAKRRPSQEAGHGRATL